LALTDHLEDSSNKKRTILKHRQTNCKCVTQFNWQKEGEKYAAVITASNESSTSTQG